MTENNQEFKQALSFLYLMAIAADGIVDDNEIAEVTKSVLFSKYTSTDANGNEFEKDLEIKDRIEAAFKLVNPVLNKAELKVLFNDILGIVCADGDLDDNESALLDLYTGPIDLSEDEIKGIYKNRIEKNKAKIEEMEKENELALALGFVYFYLVAADGDFSDEEKAALQEYKIFNKYSGAGAIGSDFANDKEDLLDRFDLAFKVINAKLTKDELKELFYEANKLIFADGELDDNEQTIFGAISLKIALSEEEKKVTMDRYTQEIKEKLAKLKAQNASSDSGSSGCFVVTATYGDQHHPNVVYLREFRDSELIQYVLGRILIRIYYVTGPSFAQLIRNSETLKSISRKYLIEPLVLMLKKKRG